MLLLRTVSVSVSGLYCYLRPLISVVYDATKDHVGVHDLVTDEDHIGVCGPCYHRRLCGCLWSVLLLEAMLMSMDQAAN